MKQNLQWKKSTFYNTNTQTVTKLKTPMVTKHILWLNSKSKMVTKFKSSSFDRNLKVKLWQYSKTQIVTKLKNSNCDRKKIKKTQIVTKLQLWQNLKTWLVTQNSYFAKTQKLKLWQNSKNLNVTKLKTSNCDKMWESSK